jgi:D-amino-acid dehydrogenase
VTGVSKPPPHVNNGVTVLGGGIVGLSCALALQRDGRAVTIIDRARPGQGASYGHAGGIAVTWVSPQGIPGIVRRLPKWIVDPLGPVAVRWAYLPRLIPWFIRLRRHSSTSEVDRLSAALASLMGESWAAWDRSLTDTGSHDLVRHGGSLSVYPNRAYMESDRVPWDLRQRHGFSWEPLEGSDLRRMEPALADDYGFGIFEPLAKWCEDPSGITDALVRRLLDNGAVIEERNVTSLLTDNDAVTALRTTTGDVEVSSVVIAAGAWSHRFAGQLGHRVPLESERGYHVDLPNPGIMPARILSLAAHKVVATPMRQGLRLSGTAEFSGVDSPPDFRRADALLEIGRRALPGLNTDGFSQWSGDRPILPDSLPVIGRDPLFSNVFHAFGHSHIGFTLGPLTGELIADAVAGREPKVPLDPFRLDRFGRRKRNPAATRPE